MRPLVLAVALVAAGCGKALVSLPSGSGSPVGANTANVAAAEATRACRSVQTMTAEVSVSGSTNGRRLRARLSVGVAQPASARLEAVSAEGGCMSCHTHESCRELCPNSLNPTASIAGLKRRAMKAYVRGSAGHNE